MLKQQPGWEWYREGRPDGESPEVVAARVNRFISRIWSLDEDAPAFSSGHLIRMIAARWLSLPPGAGRYLFSQTTSMSVIGFEHETRDEPILVPWNQVARPRE
ncbi:histidine phosphatase family protein [Singulisphaera sp. GP187]|uniref:histidine phosphatase family protein n=1 Tax=Singulisphaera sp. GP187 TaxID=1882752 RepID=UPI0009FAE96E|nr:histidine phosphatase family protein [Singulisphaera sp. GP187]